MNGGSFSPAGSRSPTQQPLATNGNSGVSPRNTNGHAKENGNLQSIASPTKKGGSKGKQDDSQMGSTSSNRRATFAQSTGDTESSRGDDQEAVSAKVEQLFDTFTSTDHILQSEMMELLQEIGIDITLAALQAHAPADQYDLEEAQDIAAHFFILMRRVTDGADSKSNAVVTLTFSQYVKMKLTCSTPKDTQYKVLSPKLDVQLTPRQILLSGTGVVMFITGLLVIMTLSLLWWNTENAREERAAQTLGLSLRSFSELFERNWVDLAGKEAASETDVFTQFSNQRSQMVEAQHMAMLQGSNLATRNALQQSINTNFTSRVIMKMERRMKMTRAVMLRANPALPNTTTLLTNAVDSWRSEGWDVVAIRRGDLSVVIPSATACAAGNDCNYRVPCLASSTNSSVLSSNSTVDVHGNSAFTVSTYLSSLDVELCAAYQTTEMRAWGRQQLVSHHAEVAARVVGRGEEISLGRVLSAGTASQNSTLEWNVSVPQTQPAPCYAGNDCLERNNITATVINTNTAAVRAIRNYDAVQTYCSALPTDFDAAQLLCAPKSILTEAEIAKVVATIDHLNFEFVRTTEIVASRINRTTGVITAQVTAFRFAPGCYSTCFRSVPSSVNAIAAFDTRGTGYSITPDYRPEPVIGGYSYVPFLDIAVLIERDVHEIRGLASDTLIAILDTINSDLDDVEVIAMRPENYPPIKTFNPFEPCPRGVTCFDAGDHGIVYRGDCSHCERLVDAKVRGLRFLTRMKDASCYDGRRNCSDSALSRVALHYEPFKDTQSVAERPDDEPDVFVRRGYTEENMLAGAFYIQNVSLGLVVHWPVSTYTGPIIQIVGLSVGVAVGFVVLALIILMLQSRKYLDAIEDEWSSYKSQISQENEKFAETVVEVLPAKVARMMMVNKHSVFAESQPLTVMMIGFSGFQRFTAGWEPSTLANHISYFSRLVTAVAQHYKIHKVRTFGDQVLFAGGLSDERDQDTMAKVSQRCVHAGCSIIELISYMYVHYPTSPAIADGSASPTKPGKPTASGAGTGLSSEKMTDFCQLRVGIHHGVAIVHVYQNVTPHFDIVGPVVSMAVKLSQVAKPNTVNISSVVREQLERKDQMDHYVFEKARNVMQKKVVTQGFLIKAAKIQLPAAVIQALNIRRANPRMYYLEGRLSYIQEDPKEASRGRKRRGVASEPSQDTSDHSPTVPMPRFSTVSGDSEGDVI